MTMEVVAAGCMQNYTYSSGSLRLEQVADYGNVTPVAAAPLQTVPDSTAIQAQM